MVDRISSILRNKIMDTSEKYIKMCEKAEEVQKLKNLKEIDSLDEGDFYYNPFQKKVLVYPFGYPNHRWNRAQCIWLPRQDQLQEMVDYNDGSQYELIEEFWNWCNTENEYGETKFAIFKTMEQLWLSFIMWKLYHKVWDDNKEGWKEL